MWFGSLLSGLKPSPFPQLLPLHPPQALHLAGDKCSSFDSFEKMALLAIASLASVGFTTDLEALLISSGVEAGFRKYLTDLDINDLLDLVPLANTDKCFEKVLGDAGLEDPPREKVKARKCWFLAREARDQRRAAAPSGSGSNAVIAASDDSPLGHGIVESLRDGFHLKHAFYCPEDVF